MFEVTDAKREQLIGSIGFIGPSGAGKTLSMLFAAFGLVQAKNPDLESEKVWQKIGVIDTEHQRSKIYANTLREGVEIGSFKHLNFPAPYSVERLDEAIKLLKKTHQVDVIIIDSISHFWEGEGGILDKQQQFGGTFQAWRDVNPIYEEFISLVTGDKYEVDTFNGIRAKQAYEVGQSETGKLKVEKLGLKPTQRDSLEYEFHIVFNIDMEHVASTTKDNSGLFERNPKKITTEHGVLLHDWLKEGKDVFAERRAEQEKAQKERDSLASYIRESAESDDKIVALFTQDMIKRVEKTYEKVEKMPLERLKAFVDAVKGKAKKAEASKEQEAKTVKGLREVAKSFKIKGYTKMTKDELQEAIKEAQNDRAIDDAKEVARQDEAGAR